MRCAFGHDVMANVWMHNGFLQVEGEKMSKSLGNFVTIHELLHTEKFGGRKWPGEVLAPRDAAHALSPADRLDGEGAGRGGHEARERLDEFSQIVSPEPIGLRGDGVRKRHCCSTIVTHRAVVAGLR